MPNISKKAKEKCLKTFGEHRTFLSRITKTLYYGKLPTTDRLSFPVTEFATELFSEAKKGASLERLHYNDAATISRNACVSPCSFILAMLYLERLKSCNPEYLQKVAPSELFLVSLMVSSKFLFDDGEDDEVFIDEWALSGGVTKKDLVKLEQEFLKAIDWNIFVNEVTFWKKLGELERILAKKEGKIRGWFTYTELCNLSTNFDTYSLYNYLFSLSMVLIVTYTAGILTIVGAMFIVSHIPGNCLRPLQPIQEAENNLITNNSVIINTPIKYELTKFVNNKHSVDVVNVLKAGLILASIKTSYYSHTNDSFCCDTNNEINEDNKEFISWDWWNNPTMDWLTKISENAQSFVLFTVNLKIFNYDYSDVQISNSKVMELRDHIHKGTATRIQDQLERSWHKEWTDVLKGGFNQKMFNNYMKNLKV
ncbi:protein CNPPD1 [Onthophagus taurus]|uniref:protein CNPPD1 n=1 Tax=Onthophagus taurus TaxID=166361 RepID=UPI000C20FD59|nr:protein CNPPD1 [Onthophagus taurus]